MNEIVYFKITNANNKSKKYTAFFYDHNMNLIKRTDFGASGYEDYTTHKDPVRKDRYIARHSNGRENWEDFTSAGSLSRYILWEYPDLDTAINAYLKRFGLIEVN